MNDPSTKPNKNPPDHPKDPSLWWLLALIVTAIMSTVVTYTWLQSEVNTMAAVETLAKELEKVRPQWQGKAAVPPGAILLFGEKCPETYIDISSDYDGRYVWVDKSITTSLKTFDTDGSHEHNAGDGEHSHHVSGVTSNLDKGKNIGSAGYSVSAIAEPDGSGHKHAGGAHEHKRIGVRLCRAPSN